MSAHLFVENTAKMNKHLHVLTALDKRCSDSDIFIPCHTIVAGYYGFMLVVHSSVVLPSIRPFFVSG